MPILCNFNMRADIGIFYFHRFASPGETGKTPTHNNLERGKIEHSGSGLIPPQINEVTSDEKIEAIIKPFKLDEVKEALQRLASRHHRS